jgi:predicted nucleic acid-binding protein
MDTLFIDTSAWVAVVNSRDQYHQAAGDFYRQNFNHYAKLITSNLVVAETYIILWLDCGSATALKWWKMIADSIKIEIIYADAGLTADAFNLLQQYEDQRISLTDAISFKIMEERKLREAFTFDSHFSTAGFVKLP